MYTKYYFLTLAEIQLGEIVSPGFAIGNSYYLLQSRFNKKYRQIYDRVEVTL